MSGQKEKSDGEEAAPPGRFAKLKPVIIAVVLLAAGAGAGFGGATFLGGGETAVAAPEGSEEQAGHGEEEPKAEAHGDGGGGGGGHGEPAPAHGEEAAAGAHGAPAAAAAVGNRRGRAVVPLGPFTVNLRGSGGGRVLRADVSLEVRARDGEVVEEEKAQLRDAVISLASDYTYADLEGIDGKTHMRDEMLARVNGLLEDVEVYRIYFTEFIVQ